MRKNESADFYSVVCPFCDHHLSYLDDIKVGICAACLDVIHNEQDVAWESHRERKCECGAVLQIGQNMYCEECQKKAGRMRLY